MHPFRGSAPYMRGNTVLKTSTGLSCCVICVQRVGRPLPAVQCNNQSKQYQSHRNFIHQAQNLKLWSYNDEPNLERHEPIHETIIT